MFLFHYKTSRQTKKSVLCSILPLGVLKNMPEELKNTGGTENLTLEERRVKFGEEYSAWVKKYKLSIVPDKVTLALEETEDDK